MKDDKKCQGLHAYRYENNPLERIFAEEWARENRISRDPNMLDQLMTTSEDQGSGSAFPRWSRASERDQLVAATVVQWLGSNVGVCFIAAALKRGMEEDREARDQVKLILSRLPDVHSS